MVVAVYPHNASIGVQGGVAAVLGSSMCVWDEKRVLSQDRGGDLELRPDWDEHHSEPHSAGGRVSTSTLHCLDYIGVRSSFPGAHPGRSSTGAMERGHISPVLASLQIFKNDIWRFVFKAVHRLELLHLSLLVK